MILNLERIRLAVFENGEGIDFAREAEAYALAFRDFGIDPETLNSQEAAERISCNHHPDRAGLGDR